MASKPDTLKIALADVDTVSGKLNKAAQGRTLFVRPREEVQQAVTLLERTARRLRKSFSLDD